MVSTVIPVPPFDLVIFGATGDLAHRKILPSLFRRLAVHQMPAGSRVIGAARSKMSKAEFRKSTRDALNEFVDPKLLKPELVEEFLNCVDYVPVDAAGDAGWATLAK
jgi:glucose-6-phosphate 1-dehydrogenase